MFRSLEQIPVESDEDLFFKQKAQDMIEKLNKDDGESIQKVMNEFDGRVSDMTICPQYSVEGRLVVRVKYATIDNINILVDRLFYCSTGTSRNVIGLKGMWLPCIGYAGEILTFESPIVLRLTKLLDEKITTVASDYIDNSFDDIMYYGRHIDSLNAACSSFLNNADIDQYTDSFPVFKPTSFLDTPEPRDECLNISIAE